MIENSLLNTKIGAERTELSFETLRSVLLDLTTSLKNAGVEGLIFGRWWDDKKVLHPRIVSSAKVVIPLKEESETSIENNVDRLVSLITESPDNLGKDPGIACRANWFFAEYTPATRNLNRQGKWLNDTDYRGNKKHLVYFDADLKDTITKEVYSTMTSGDKEKWVIHDSHDKLEALIKKTDPLYISFTGSGFHVAYLASDLVLSSRDFTKSKRAYGDAYDSVARELRRITGFKFDPSCKSLNRIDRVPYTYNLKPKVDDSFSSLLYFNSAAKTSFLQALVDKTNSLEIQKRVIENAGKSLGMYRLFPQLKDRNPLVYKHIRSELTFAKVFEYYDISDKLGYSDSPYGNDFKGFITCYSPFRTQIFEEHVTDNVEHQASFRYDEHTKIFYDFGVIPGAPDVKQGDVLGLAYALGYYQTNGVWPLKIPLDKAQELALTMLGGKTEAELGQEVKGFLRDEKGNVIADLDNIMLGVVAVILSRYELVFNRVQNQFFHRRKGTEDTFKIFPWECSEFGNKDKATIGRFLINLGGLGNPASSVSITAKHAVDFLVDPVSVRITPDGLHAYWDMDILKEFTFPVIDMAKPVLRFEDGVYYHIRTGDVTDQHDGFAYSVKGIEYKDITDPEKGKTPLFDKLLHSMIGPEESPERMVFRFILAQMWVPAHGDSRALIIRGNGKNGKSTFIEVLTSIMPEGVTFATSIETLTGKGSSESADRMGMLGKHLVMVGDMRTRSLDRVIKNIITGDAGMIAKLLYKNPVNFKNMATLLFMANDIPKISDDVSAFLRRFLIIESKVKVKDPMPDMHIRIVKEELAGVWKYILKSIDYFRDNHNFYFPETADWAKKVITPMKQQLLNQFSTGELAMRLQPSVGKVVSIRKLFSYYNEYTHETGVRSSGLKGFASRISSIVEGDNDIYGENWKPLFDKLEMDEHMVTVYNNGQLEYLINTEFSTPILSDANDNSMNMNLDSVLRLKHDNMSVVFQSIKYPASKTSDTLLRIKAWRDKQVDNPAKGKVSDMDNSRVNKFEGGSDNCKKRENSEKVPDSTIALL